MIADDKTVKHWCEYIERICANSKKIEGAQKITDGVADTYEQFVVDVHKVYTFLSHLQDLVQDKVRDMEVDTPVSQAQRVDELYDDPWFDSTVKALAETRLENWE